MEWQQKKNERIATEFLNAGKKIIKKKRERASAVFCAVIAWTDPFFHLTQTVSHHLNGVIYLLFYHTCKDIRHRTHRYG